MDPARGACAPRAVCVDGAHRAWRSFCARAIGRASSRMVFLG